MSNFPIVDVDQIISTLPPEIQNSLKSAKIEELELDIKKIKDELKKLFQSLVSDENKELSNYIEHVVFPALFLSRAYQGEKLFLPMLDQEKFSKENALPYFLWGLLYDKWEPNQEEDGLSVFIQGYDKRGPQNHRKRIYYSAITPDLYSSNYRGKVVQFFDQLLDKKNAGKPLMREYLDSYFNLYWNLHLSLTGDEIPKEVREIGESFNTALAYLTPTKKIVFDNYMKVRQLRPFLQDWLEDKIKQIKDGNISNYDQTFVYYWLKNSNDGNDENFRIKDISFECFHNFVALSQWGNTIYKIMDLLCEDNKDSDVIRECFEKTMESGDYDQANGSPFTPLDRFVMELFRTLSPNGGSVSFIQETTSKSLYKRYGYIITPHEETSKYSIHWKDPQAFNPDRYLDAPTSDQIDEAKSKEIGFAKCPFHKETFKVKDGRNTELTNSAFGTVYSTNNDQKFPVCDYAGYAPFGFGYRRCPGELFTVEVIKEFLRKVWNDKIKFEKLDITAKEVPVGPGAVVKDNIGFTKP